MHLDVVNLIMPIGWMLATAGGAILTGVVDARLERRRR